MIDLNEYQSKLREWQLKNFPNQANDSLAMVVGMTEELGELAHAVLKNLQKIRNMEDTEDMKAAVADAYGDINVYGAQLLSILGINIETALTDAMETVLKRDWTQNKTDGSVS